jgi:ParB-like chromosome segregation protein Spo0J
MTALLIEDVDISTLKFDKRNARKHSAKNIDAIAASLSEFGQRRPLVVQGDVVIAGNGTLEAAKGLGWATVAITRVPETWTEKQARAFALADNRTAELAEWDHDVLLSQLQEIGETLVEASGFQPADLSTLSSGLTDLEHTPAPGSADFIDIPEDDNYQQQYGVNVLCDDPDDQMRAYQLITELGYTCKVVTV